MVYETQIDEIDIKILAALLKDARCNFSEIAENCRISIVAVSQRFKKLKQNGTIMGTTLIMSPENQRSSSIDIRAESHYEDAIMEAIENLPNVINCFRTIGKYDIHAAVRVNSLEEIDKIKNKIRKESGVLAIEISTSLDDVFLLPENLLAESKEWIQHGRT